MTHAVGQMRGTSPSLTARFRECVPLALKLVALFLMTLELTLVRAPFFQQLCETLFVKTLAEIREKLKHFSEMPEVRAFLHSDFLRSSICRYLNSSVGMCGILQASKK